MQTLHFQVLLILRLYCRSSLRIHIFVCADSHIYIFIYSIFMYSRFTHSVSAPALHIHYARIQICIFAHYRFIYPHARFSYSANLHIPYSDFLHSLILCLCFCTSGIRLFTYRPICISRYLHIDISLFLSLCKIYKSMKHESIIYSWIRMNDYKSKE